MRSQHLYESCPEDEIREVVRRSGRRSSFGLWWTLNFQPPPLWAPQDRSAVPIYGQRITGLNWATGKPIH